MTKKKVARKKTPVSKKAPVRKQTPARKKTIARKKTVKRRSKPARRKKAVRPAKSVSPNQLAPTPRRSPLTTSLDAKGPGRRGLGAGSAGQSGDTQDLSDVEDVDSESVEELIEEGQSFEAGVVAGVEDADARPKEVRSKQTREDDVPPEYLDED